jgi:hypothetical protein
MIINNITPAIQKTNNKSVSSKGGREIIRTLSNSDTLVATIALESFVTGGRGINAYKRGGFPEFRERFTDDVVSAVFWMKGVDMFNKIGNKFGEHVLKLPTTEFDVGKDALRTPFNNVVADLGEKITDEKALKSMEKKLATFKFSKILLSTVMATGFVGFALPKINQFITRKIMNRNKDENKQNKEQNSQFNLLEKYSFENFEKQLSSNKQQSFKGLSPEVMTTVAHYLENNKICKMLSCDVGILTGRVATARNADEGREYFFRDATSSFFYFASTPIVYKLLQTISKSADTTSIDPVAAKQIHENMLQQLKNADGTFAAMNTNEFAAKTIGILDDKAKDLISKLPFNSDVISLKELSKHINNENLLQKATEMAKLQPQQAGVGNVLTKQQVQDVLKSGSINNPEFMQEIFNSKFGDALTNPYKFIPMKKITTFRNNIERYSQKVIDIANKQNGGVVDKNLLEKINKKSYAMSFAFRIMAMGVSAFALGFAIPKLQYAMTARRTGKNEAPGLREFKQDEDKKVNK